MTKRKRVYTNDQTHFSKEFYKVGQENYLTDIDGIFVNTENEIYSHYKFDSKTKRPRLTRILEVKHKPTDHIRGQVSNTAKPTAQTYFFAEMVSEINYFRESKSDPLVEFWYVIQSEGKYPHYVYTVDYKDAEVEYVYKGKIETEEEFVKEMRK